MTFACLQGANPSTLPLVGSLGFGVRSAVLCLSSEAEGADRPLVELCLRMVEGKLELEEQSLSWGVDAQLAMNVFSTSHAGWEPVLEPWRFQITGDSPIAWCGVFCKLLSAPNGAFHIIASLVATAWSSS